MLGLAVPPPGLRSPLGKLSFSSSGPTMPVRKLGLAFPPPGLRSPVGKLVGKVGPSFPPPDLWCPFGSCASFSSSIAGLLVGPN
ncbi:hypothetical protein SDJN03_01808, partial [Cucurbita argyrosperma subsp. sororia]